MSDALSTLSAVSTAVLENGVEIVDLAETFASLKWTILYTLNEK